MEDRQHEGRGLPRPGLRGAEQVAPCKHMRDRLLLDGCRFGVPLGFDGAEELGGKSKVCEVGHQCGKRSGERGLGCDDRGMTKQETLLGALAPAAPLAARMRPTTLDEMVGQEALIGPGAPLRRLLERGEAPSLLLWGPPGSGKSTLAAVIAAAVRATATSLSATSDGVAEVRKVVAAATERRAHGEQTLLFIDELHRFSRTQQDALLQIGRAHV